MRKELLIGCGHRRERILPGPGPWECLTTLDNNEACKPDVVFDLNLAPYPFLADEFDEIHAYDVLEHVGAAGAPSTLLDVFSELWRILKPGGMLYGITPWWSSEWAWADPGHGCVIAPGTLLFLSQAEYAARVGKGPMSDYRETYMYKADFNIARSMRIDDSHVFWLQAVKG